LKIRQAATGDAAGIETLLESVWNDDDDAKAYFEPDLKTGLNFVALEGDVVVGLATIQTRAWHPTRDYVGVHVHPEHRARGLGAQLYEALLPLMKDRARALQTAKTETEVQTKPWLEARGFQEIMRTYTPRVDPRAVNLAPFTAAMRGLSDGVRIVTLEEHSDLTDTVAELHHHIYTETHTWNPTATFPLERLRRVYIGEDLIPEAMFVALDGDRPIGVASLRPGDDSSTLELAWTGILRDAGKNRLEILDALISHCLEYAVNANATIMGEFDSLNPDAMHILEMLGVERGTAWLTFQRDAVL
jgi:GNAT superfamily N-acetyltransferase